MRTRRGTLAPGGHAENRLRNRIVALFQPGQSGNPGGRPKGRADAFRTAIAKATKDGKDIVAAVVPLLCDESPLVRLRAAEFLTDRFIGKAVQAVELTGADGGPVAVEDVRHQLIARAAALAESDRATAVH